MELQETLALFQELLRCGNDIYLWRYDENGQLLDSNCPNEALFGAAFSIFGLQDRMLAHARAHDKPVTLGTEFGLLWGVAVEKKNGVFRGAYAIGPAFSSNSSVSTIERSLQAYPEVEMSMIWKHHFLDALHCVPAVQNIMLSRYLLMLHYCITGQRLGACDLHVTDTVRAPLLSGSTEKPHRDRQMVYMAERAMLQMVRFGELDYQKALGNSILLSNGVPVQSPDPLRQGKISSEVFCSLVCRAAIEGGLSPDEAYELGNYYIQASESATTYDDLSAIGGIMYDDFVRRVHKRRTNPKLSHQVQKCCDYIEMNLEKKLQAADLAKLVGYSEYYITRRFREETGLGITDYVKYAKVERAKLLLAATDLPIPEIAEQLAFTTRSYFGQVFKQVAGMTPAEYRARQRNG